MNTCHPIYGMGKRSFNDALPPRFLLSGIRSVGSAGPREGGSVPKSLRPSRAGTLTLDLRYVSRRVQCAYEVEDAGCEKKR
jgi:hypothetical protein